MEQANKWVKYAYDRGFEDGRAGGVVCALVSSMSGAATVGILWALVHFL